MRMNEVARKPVGQMTREEKFEWELEYVRRERDEAKAQIEKLRGEHRQLTDKVSELCELANGPHGYDEWGDLDA